MIQKQVKMFVGPEKLVSLKKLKELEFKVASLKHSAVVNKKKIMKQPRDMTRLHFFEL